jgi:hypothetical protein
VWLENVCRRARHGAAPADDDAAALVPFLLPVTFGSTLSLAQLQPVALLKPSKVKPLPKEGDGAVRARPEAVVADGKPSGPAPVRSR